MKKLSWQKCPSVTPGGKDYFYFISLGLGNSYSVVWDRQKQKWCADKNHKTIALFDSAKEGQKYVEDLVKNIA